MNILKASILFIAFLTIGCASTQKTNISELNIKKTMENSYLSSVQIMDNLGHTIGSGTIVKNDSREPMIAITANHVTDEMESIYLGLAYSVVPIKVHVYRASKDVDISILVADTPNVKGGPYVNIATRSPRIGDNVWTVGNPRGRVRNVTTGVISEAVLDSKLDATWYGITTPVYFGSSGGGLFNESGNLVGVVVSLSMIPGRIMIGNDEIVITVDNMFAVVPESGAARASSLDNIKQILATM
jgi:S1-C subfamily serine protease